LKYLLTLLFICCFSLAKSQSQKILLLDSGKNTSLRGLSVVNDKVAWVSGSNGWVAKMVDGKSFSWQQVKGFEKLDFRDIESFSADEAIIINAGYPAYILKTKDGGQTWKTVYENKDSLIFLDGMDFWNAKEGIIFGDPINGIMKLLVTKDAGETWQDVSAKANVNLKEGEASFAASGTTIRTFKNKVYIATGGKHSRLWNSADKAQTWSVEDIDIIKGEASTGTFSIAINQNTIYAVGGDYLKEESAISNYSFKSTKENTWTKIENNPKGYRSAIEVINKKVILATGPSGVDISNDAGQSWQLFSPKGFHTCRRAIKGKLILFTGSRGQIGKLI